MDFKVMGVRNGVYLVSLDEVKEKVLDMFPEQESLSKELEQVKKQLAIAKVDAVTTFYRGLYKVENESINDYATKYIQSLNNELVTDKGNK